MPSLNYPQGVETTGGAHTPKLAHIKGQAPLISALGGALYMHAKLAAQADEAADAVRYLEEKNII